MSKLDALRKMAEHYKNLANRADDSEKKAHYDKLFERAARDYNTQMLKERG
jgi:hypothetical protein